MPRARNLTSITELRSLAACEMQWYYKYIKHEKKAKGWALIRGLAMHALCREWETIAWPDRPLIANDVDALMGPVLTKVLDGVEAEDGVRPELTDEQFDTLVWLFHRWVGHWALQEETPYLVSIDHETRMQAKVPGTSQFHECIADALWLDERDGNYWLVERKTFGRGSKINLTVVDPQLTLNLWVAQQNASFPIRGIVWDGIYTYKWVKPRPLADTCKRLWLPRSERQIDAALRDVRAGLRRRDQLRRGTVPRRNLGDHCSWCDHQNKCWADLGVEDFVFEDDGADN